MNYSLSESILIKAGKRKTGNTYIESRPGIDEQNTSVYVTGDTSWFVEINTGDNLQAKIYEVNGTTKTTLISYENNLTFDVDYDKYAIHHLTEKVADSRDYIKHLWK